MSEGDLVAFDGRVGKVVGFRPGGMVDVSFDGQVERRRKGDLTPAEARENGDTLPWWSWGILAAAVLFLAARKR